MVLLIDTNVILDYLTKREGFFEHADKVIKYCAQSENDGYVAFHSISNIWFILRKRPAAERRAMLKGICNILAVADASHEIVINALDREEFADFEDCLQDECATEVRAEYIITRNTADYKISETKAIAPIEFCNMLKL